MLRFTSRSSPSIVSKVVTSPTSSITTTTSFFSLPSSLSLFASSRSFFWKKSSSKQHHDIEGGVNSSAQSSGTAAATARAMKQPENDKDKYRHPLEDKKDDNNNSSNTSQFAYHEHNVRPDQRHEVYREREWWEFTPTPEHTSLVLLLYRSLLKELIKLPTVRKRTFITYVRLTFRRRAKATEKLLIDECIEEARRGIYVASKHNQMKETGEYKMDDMFLPKDTGQDVATFMEEVYDPVMSKRAMENAKDVVPGQEGISGNTLRGAHYQTDRMARESMKEQLNRPAITEDDLKLRPPPPPTG